ncbi:MAG TPA: helix-turn-helix transcriptional regulator [Pseudolabrys sp.]|jgi:DNA-binding XRE family transcriptional regulator|nr:helix-turn-helix transcriptional regulator [Pseudolabrys sp.]
MHLVSHRSPDLVELVRMERRAFAAKVRIARAVLGWSQAELAATVGLTQRAVHMLEQGETEPRRTTVLALEEVWRAQGLVFEDAGDGAFTVTVRSAQLDRPVSIPARQRRRNRLDLGVTARKRAHA